MITLYDSIYGDISSKELTYEEFKDKYLQSVQIGNQSVKEAYVVGQIQRIIAEKDYEEVDTMFQLYTVMKEERNLLESLKYMPEEFDLIASTHTDEIAGLSEEQRERLNDLRARKYALKAKLDINDARQL